MFQLSNLTQWQWYVRYLSLTSIVFIAHEFSGFLEKMVMDGVAYGWALLFLWYLLFFIVGDNIVLFLLNLTGWEAD